MAIVIDLGALALTISIINTILIVMIANKIKFRPGKDDILTIISVLIQVLYLLKSNPANEKEAKALISQLQRLLKKLE